MSPIKIIKQHSIIQENQLKIFLQEVTQKNAEGMVVRNPNTAYQTGRLSSALKVKKHLDTECVIEKYCLAKANMQGRWVRYYVKPKAA